MALDLDRYRRRAEQFLGGLDREYYLHLSGRKPELDIEPIYEQFGDLFEPGVVDSLRQARDAGQGEVKRATGQLLQFAVDGHLGRATRSEEAELAGLESSLEVEVGAETHPYRRVPIILANEPDPDRRAELEGARNDVLEGSLNPIHRASLERARRGVTELGWSSYKDAYEEVRGIDLGALAADAAAFIAATDSLYESVMGPELSAAGVPELGALRRSDLPRFFRAPELDGPFDGERLLPSLTDTLSGLGIDLAAQTNVHVDAESRPTKSPRAFCATAHVPDEIYLVVAPAGGREDFAAMFHEGGHAEHFAHMDAALPFESRYLGDNTVTESFAFLFEHLTADPAWLAGKLGVEEPEPISGHAQAVKLLMLRRYAAKIAYEVQLHGDDGDLDTMRSRYAELLGGATRVGWDKRTWLSDVDPGFYVACYLRAWALEARWRHALQDRFGERWYESRAAGEWLRELWRDGQRLDGDELLAQTLGEELSLTALRDEFAFPSFSTSIKWTAR